MQSNPRTVDEVFKDFKGRRSGMLKALTTGSSCFELQLFYLFIRHVYVMRAMSVMLLRDGRSRLGMAFFQL